MSTTKESSDKAAIRRFRDAVNTGDRQLIAKTIEEVVEHFFAEMQQLGVTSPALAAGKAV